MSSYSAFSGLPVPVWQNWTPTLAGFTGSPSVLLAQYAVLGKTVLVQIAVQGTGDSSGAHTFTLPLACAVDFEQAVRIFDSAGTPTENYALCGANPATDTTHCLVYAGPGTDKTWSTGGGTHFWNGQFFYQSA